MRLTMLTALGAALLLAACGSSSNDAQPLANGTDLASANPVGGVSATATDGVSQGILPGSSKEFETVVGNTVHFETDSHSLNPEAQASLQKQAKWLQTYREHAVTVEGHADERGTREYNLALGDRRAQTVVNYLTALGIDAARLKEVSYGKEKPVCADATDACWSENRRGVTALDN